MDEDNKIDKNGDNRTIKNLAKFKSLKNSAKYEKLIKNLVKFKIFEKPSFLSFAIRLVYT